MNYLKNIRQLKGLSLYKLAKNIGTTPSHIKRLEEGKTKLTLEWATRLSSILSCTPADILGYENLGILNNDKLDSYDNKFKEIKPSSIFLEKNIENNFININANTKKITQIIHNNLKKLRLAKNLSIDDLIQNSNIKKQEIILYEKQLEIPLYHLVKLSIILDCHPKDISYLHMDIIEVLDILWLNIIKNVDEFFKNKSLVTGSEIYLVRKNQVSTIIFNKNNDYIGEFKINNYRKENNFYYNCTNTKENRYPLAATGLPPYKNNKK